MLCDIDIDIDIDSAGARTLVLWIAEHVANRHAFAQLRQET